MSFLTIFVLGVVTGWVLEWVFDLLFFRASDAELHAATEQREEHLDASATIDRLRRQRDVVRTDAARLRTELETVRATASRPADVEPEAPSQLPLLGDDLTVVEGIGPKIAAVLAAGGIRTWADLGATPSEEIKTILGAAGPHLARAVPDTWPEQARLAAAGAWEELRSLQHGLSGGRRKDEV